MNRRFFLAGLLAPLLPIPSGPDCTVAHARAVLERVLAKNIDDTFEAGFKACINAQFIIHRDPNPRAAALLGYKGEADIHTCWLDPSVHETTPLPS